MKEKITLSIRKTVLEAVFSKIPLEEFEEIDEIFEDAILLYYNIRVDELGEKNSTLILDDEGNYLLEKELNYVYAFLDPRFINQKNFNVGFEMPFEPFYIGKGQGDRIDKAGRNSRVEKRILEIKNSGEEVVKIKIFENVSRYDSFKLENSLISKIGREDQGMGPLLNSSGGRDFQKHEITYSPINIENQINRLILNTLNSSGKISKAARKLGISQRTLYRKMKGLGIVKKDKIFVIQ